MQRINQFVFTLSIFTLGISPATNAMDKQKSDPFASANKHYSNSEWDLAYQEYSDIFKKIDSESLDKTTISKEAFIKGNVNYADVLRSLGVTDWAKGHHEQAKAKWLTACKHYSYRLEDGRFGRKPLGDEEWDGSDPKGKTIVVLSERDGGAFGDTFYASFLLRHLKNRGANVVFVPQIPLKKLYETEGTLQAGYVDKVCLRGEKLPQHDGKIYLWSLFEDYIKKNKQPFPVKPWMSGPSLTNELKQLLKPYAGTFLVGFWYRGSGDASQAADNRSLDRDFGAHLLLTALKDIPNTTLICLEGRGHGPINKTAYKQLKKENKLNPFDRIDKTTHDTSNVVIPPKSFDSTRGAFVDTAAVMSYIKKQNGLLVGIDTGLLNLAAAIEKPKRFNGTPQVIGILNNKADMRWGSKVEKQNNGAVKPGIWTHSSDVMVLQAPEQYKLKPVITQLRTIVEERAKKYKQVMNS